MSYCEDGKRGHLRQSKKRTTNDYVLSMLAVPACDEEEIANSSSNASISMASSSSSVLPILASSYSSLSPIG